MIFISFGFIPSLQSCQLLMCLPCHQTLTNLETKPSCMKYCIDAKYSNKKNKLLSYFLQLINSFKKQTLNTLLQETSKQKNDGLIASHSIALLVTKSGKSLHYFVWLSKKFCQLQCTKNPTAFRRSQ